MKELLEFAGTILYMLFSILFFPLLVITQCLLETWAAIKYTRKHYRQWVMSARKKAGHYNPLPHYIHLAVTRIKSLHW